MPNTRIKENLTCSYSEAETEQQFGAVADIYMSKKWNEILIVHNVNQWDLIICYIIV